MHAKTSKHFTALCCSLRGLSRNSYLGTLGLAPLQWCYVVGKMSVGLTLGFIEEKKNTECSSAHKANLNVVMSCLVLSCVACFYKHSSAAY